MTVRVVIAEDSPTARALLLAIFADDPEIKVVGECTDGDDAVKLAKRLQPDVMTMDLHMPRMDGLEAIRRIMTEAPTRIVVVSDSIGEHDVQASMEALRAGALTALPKPCGPAAAEFPEQSRQLISTVKALSEVKVVRRWGAAPAPTPSAPPPPQHSLGEPERPAIVVVGASTGGPAALHRILSELPSGAPAPVVIVQHIAHGFLPGLVDWWNSVSKLRVKIAQDGERLLPGTVFVAPDDRHLVISGRDTVRLVNAPPVGGHRPSANYLFESAARIYRAQTMALILTGMGRDGVDGLVEVHRAGGHVIAQDEQSSVVFGMPGAAVQAGVAREVLPLQLIASRIAQALGNMNGSVT